jgi:shikimate kinase
MATGKTTVGAVVAEALGRALLDCDELLTARTGATAAEIAERDGVDALHALEADVLLDALRASDPAVITAAGSTIEFESCRAALRDAFVVWLRADVAQLAARIREKPHRPLDDNVEEQLRDQAARRDALFAAAADLVIDVDERSPDVAADLVVQASP